MQASVVNCKTTLDLQSKCVYLTVPAFLSCKRGIAQGISFKIPFRNVSIIFFLLFELAELEFLRHIERIPTWYLLYNRTVVVSIKWWDNTDVCRRGIREHSSDLL